MPVEKVDHAKLLGVTFSCDLVLVWYGLPIATHWCVLVVIQRRWDDAARDVDSTCVYIYRRGLCRACGLPQVVECRHGGQWRSFVHGRDLRIYRTRSQMGHEYKLMKLDNYGMWRKRVGVERAGVESRRGGSRQVGSRQAGTGQAERAKLAWHLGGEGGGVGGGRGKGVRGEGRGWRGEG